MPTPAELLCLVCGFCCDGTLHSFTFLSTSEVSLAEGTGLRIKYRRDRTPIFTQPCHVYRNARCSIYSERPWACQKYECKLLQALNRGEMDLPTVIDKQNQVQLLISAIRAQMDELIPGHSLERQVRMNWPHHEDIPSATQTAIQELTRKLHQHYGVRWYSSSLRFSRWKRLLLRNR